MIYTDQITGEDLPIYNFPVEIINMAFSKLKEGQSSYFMADLFSQNQSNLQT